MKFRSLLPGLLIGGLLPAAAETTRLELEGAVAEVYKTASGDDLYLYVFKPPDHDPEKDRRPAIVFFFGGGWNGGTPTQFEQHSRYLASRGMVAAVADYRVRSRQGTSPRECVADGKSAVRYLRKNAGRLGIDPARIAAGGGSAGGHVAATTGFCDGLDDPAEADSEISSKSNALALFNPVYDNGPGGYGHDRARKWFPAISPAHNITKDDPPAIVFLGTKDSLIPVATGEKFKADMEAAGLESELHLYEGKPHGFFNEAKGGFEIFADTIRKLDAFLVDLGYLEGGADEDAIQAVSKTQGKPVAKKKKKASEPGESMEATARLTGFIAAHAIWSVSDGELLIPILATEDASRKRTLNRLVADRVEEGVERGQRQLKNLPAEVTRAVLAYDGRITLDAGKVDAIILEARRGEEVSLSMAVPYKPADSGEGFAVYRPKFLKVEPAPDDLSPIAGAFFQGVDSHTKAAKVWNDHLDQSL